MTSYFELIEANRYRPTQHAGGAWADDELHLAPVSGAVVDAVDRFLAGRPPRHLSISRLSFDVLGKLPATDFDVAVTFLRPGRTIELLEATVIAAGRSVLQARIWLLANQDTSAVAGGLPHPLPDPETLPAETLTRVWTGGFVESLQLRPCEEPVPGRARVWLSTGIDLVAGRPVSALARFVAVVDTANGIAVREPPAEWMFPNVDLTIHLYRTPAGPWVGLDTTVTFGLGGHGLTSTVLHDIHGPVGRAEQILTLRKR